MNSALTRGAHDFAARFGTGRLRRREKDQERELFLDGVEPMFDAGAHEHHAAELYRAVGAADPDLSPPRDDVIHLVLGVRLLGVNTTCGEDVQTHAQGTPAKKLEIGTVRWSASSDQVGQTMDVPFNWWFVEQRGGLGDYDRRS